MIVNKLKLRVFFLKFKFQFQQKQTQFQNFKSDTCHSRDLYVEAGEDKIKYWEFNFNSWLSGFEV